MEILRAAGTVHVPGFRLSPEELSRECASGSYDVVVSQLRDRLDADLLARARLTGISNYAAGFDNIDISAAARHSIMVGNTPGILTDATADVTLLLILATARRAVEADALMRAGRYMGWEPQFMLGLDVSGATLGLAGFGRIARATARRAIAFGMKIIFCPRPPGHRPVTAGELAEFGGEARAVGWDELVATSDFLSLHVPLSPETHHLVDEDVLGRMKSSAILINTARGPVVDEPALVRALRNGGIAAAGLDVYENEPSMSPGLAELPNTVLLPHLGSATTSVRAEMARICARNAVAMAGGNRPEHEVVAGVPAP